MLGISKIFRGWPIKLFAISGLTALIFLAHPALADSYWDHNGSLMRLKATGNERIIEYFAPSEKMKAAGVQSGTILFTGRRDGMKYIGISRRFSKWCEKPREYAVDGVVVTETQIVMNGRFEAYAEGCKPTGRIVDDNLEFNFKANDASPTLLSHYAPIDKPNQSTNNGQMAASAAGNFRWITGTTRGAEVASIENLNGSHFFVECNSNTDFLGSDAGYDVPRNIKVQSGAYSAYIIIDGKSFPLQFDNGVYTPHGDNQIDNLNSMVDSMVSKNSGFFTIEVPALNMNEDFSLIDAKQALQRDDGKSLTQLCVSPLPPALETNNSIEPSINSPLQCRSPNGAIVPLDTAACQSIGGQMVSTPTAIAPQQGGIQLVAPQPSYQQPTTPTGGPPPLMTAIQQTIVTFYDKYKTCSNQAQCTDLRFQRAEAFSRMGSTSIQNWPGKVYSLKTTDRGTLDIEIEITKSLYLQNCLWLTDSSVDSVIKRGDPIFRKAMNLSDGAEVIVSAQIRIPRNEEYKNRDFFAVEQDNERSAMQYPEICVEFTDIVAK